MDIRYGFIGCGNMGGAMAQAAARSVYAETIALSDALPGQSSRLAESLGAKSCDNDTIAASCRYVILAVKPQVLPEVLGGISPILKNRKDRFIIVSMAAGVTIASVRAMAGGDYPVIRIMPNTPALVGEGLTLYAPSDNVEEEEMAEFLKILSAAGKPDRLNEELIDAASALSGCGPAFVYMFIEALADGAVECGLQRAKALLYAEQTVLGAAKLAIESKQHPGALKDAVCSPGGSTIAGVHALEDCGFRSAAMTAVTAAFKKTKELGKPASD